MLKSCRQLTMVVRTAGALVGRASCSWMDRYGRPASPPAQRPLRSASKDRSIRRVDLCIEPGQSLGLMIRGGLEYNLGIYITGVDKDSVADRAGLMILMNSLSLLIDLVRFTNLTVLLLIGSQVTGYKHGYYNMVATLWRILTCVVVIAGLVDHCERVYRQRERIVSLLDHLIIEKNIDDPLLSALNELRDLVQSRAINFHMAHFIRIEYPLLVSIASVVVTYTIILLQSVNNN